MDMLLPSQEHRGVSLAALGGSDGGFGEPSSPDPTPGEQLGCPGLASRQEGGLIL